MEIQVLDHIAEKILYSTLLPIETKSILEIEHVNPEPASGRVALQAKCFNGLQLIIVEMQPIEMVWIRMDTHIHAYQMLFMLEGMADISYGKEADFQIISGQHFFRCIKPTHLLLHIDQTVKFIFICLRESYLKGINPGGFNWSRCMDIPASIRPIIASIISFRQLCTIKWIFLESKVLELIYLQLEQNQLLKQDDTALSIKEYDIEKIELAKTLVEQNMQNPCSLIELAHQVGLNDFKLKKGFKALYGKTVFGYLYQLRMEKARRLLLEDKKVADIAYEVGYKNAQHFAAAFKKYFGLLPRQMK
jgi:AraC-like DNA-binding protein